ncbi:ABC transporter permease [Streptomyces sp. NPDC056661]|uniref:ABC transporter permease n=1 Tax=Streptomyces sp. NPDC056661 TaxID=3345898 RepID=UPI0036A802C9
MLRFILRRTLGALVILLIISAVTFFLFFALPRDPARLACGKICTPANLELIRHNLAIDAPVWVQYGKWLVAIVVGRDFTTGHCAAPCLGYSFVNQEPIFQTIVDRFPTTVSLTIGAAVVFVVFGVGMGMIAAWKQGTIADKVASSASLIGSSMQIYFVGALATYFLVDQWHLMDRARYVPFTDNPLAWAHGLLLPWCVLAIIFTANYTRMTRSSMVEQLNEDFVRTARAKGMPERTVFLRFAWRGAMGPIITIFGVDLGVLLGGAIITEQTFTLHGIGELSIKAVINQDLPMLLAVVMVAATAIVILNIVVDAVYAAVDPRVRLT